MQRKAIMLFALVIGALLCVPTMAQSTTVPAEQSVTERSTINMPVGVTPVSHQVYKLHMYMFWLCVVVGIGVFGYMLVAMILHRKSRGHEPADFHENVVAEVAWTLVPFLILVVMAVPATVALKHLYDASDSELEIQITGYQWKWQYEYLGKGVRFISELATPQDQINNLDPKSKTYLQEVTQPLVIPVDTKVKFHVTSADVIHSWWVPDFAVKRDAIPGYNVETWTKVLEPGIYRGECAELCGMDHAFMPVVVEVKTKEDFKIWLDEQVAKAEALAAMTEKTFSKDELMEIGKAAYDRSCAACHGADGSGVGQFPPMTGSALITGPIEDHLDIVVNGKTGTAMQAFGGQLSEVDIAAIITYERNALGNNTGDVVQPIDVFNYKNGQ